MDLKETGWEGVVWIHLARGRNRWRALVNTVITIGFCHDGVGLFLLSGNVDKL
jgi:hypothetical protein